MSIPPNLAYADATFLSPGSLIPRPHGERAAECVNVLDFDAKGDGSDDTVAIQNAIDFAFGTAGSPHGYTNRTSNKLLYFPHPPGVEYRTTSPLIMTHVYGGRIYGDRTFVSNRGTGPAIITNGMVETWFEGIGLYSNPGTVANLDLDWNGTWADLPVSGQGLRHNVFVHSLMGTAQRGIRVANAGNDGSHNSFVQCIIQATSVAGIELIGTAAIGNKVIGGGCDTGVAYKQTGGQFSYIQGISNGSGTTISFDIHSNFPVTVLGGRTEGGASGGIVTMSTGLVGCYGFLFNGNSPVNVAHITGGKLTLEGCACKSDSACTITGNGGSLYIRGCDFNAGIHSTYTGTVAHEF